VRREEGWRVEEMDLVSPQMGYAFRQCGFAIPCISAL
jgi:hypothetical protein